MKLAQGEKKYHINSAQEAALNNLFIAALQIPL